MKQISNRTKNSFSGLVFASSKTLGLLFLFIAIGLYFDSSFFADWYQYGQIISNLLLIFVFIILLKRAKLRARKLMIYATIIGIGGECLFSLCFDMYTYRLENVPIYIPPGHAIIYISAYYFCKDLVVRAYKKVIEKGLLILMLIYSLFTFIVFFDVFGFVLTLLVVFTLRNRPKERLFYFTMYLVVAFLEIVGTSYNCWYWPETFLGKVPFLPSWNPPSGISFFYFFSI